MRKFPKIVASGALVALLGACNMAADGAGPATQAAAVAPLPDGTLTGTITTGLATLTVANGQPVAYTWEQPNGAVYVASNVRRLNNGDIAVDQARITGVQVGESSISGIWTLHGRSTPMTLGL
ncbi:MAG: hypothetical protein ACXIUV_01145 [Alkalilacustris sp.]